jgi:pentatricopeptide repeat protein
VGSALVDMYGKCGDMESAREVFDETVQRDVVLWTVMIATCAQHDHGKESLRLFEEMQSTGMKPDHITFIGVLSACIQEGLVNKGCEYFHSMSQDYGIIPRVEHYACMVDLLGHDGCLDEAKNLIKEVPLECGSMVWKTLLVACRVHGNMEKFNCLN